MRIFSTSSIIVALLGFFVASAGTTQSATIPVTSSSSHGSVGVGTYTTVSQFKDLKVTGEGDKALLQLDLSKGTGDFTLAAGQWKVVSGTLQQSSADEGCRATIGDAAWTDYTYTLKAQKLSGKEGFLVVFRSRDAKNFFWWNVGGWSNTKTQIEATVDGTRTAIGTSTDVIVAPNRWYDLKVQVTGDQADCYLDGKLVCHADVSGSPESLLSSTPPSHLHGAAGVGTYATISAFKDFQVTGEDGEIIAKTDLFQATGGFTPASGQWKVINGVLQQTSTDQGCRANMGDPDWTNYTVNLKAQKLSGKEGFLVVFRARDAKNFFWWNVGGWNNTKTQIEATVNGTRTAIGTSTDIIVAPNRWYDLKVEVAGDQANCYLDGELVCQANISDNPHGPVGFGTYTTVAEFKDFKVSGEGDKVLLDTDLSKSAAGFSFSTGQWSTADGALVQSSNDQGTYATIGDPKWIDYTVNLKAKKVSGKEGFLVIFRAKDAKNYFWWNIGGWNNTKTQIETSLNGTRTAIGTSTDLVVQPGRWYDLKVEVIGNEARCFLDGKLVCQAEVSGSPSVLPVAAHFTALDTMFRSKDKTQIAAAFADLKKWYGNDPVNAEHSTWRLRALLPPMVDHVADTMDVIQLAWSAKNAADGDHSDPGYLYALEASCLFQQNKPADAKVKALEGLKVDPAHASVELLDYLAKAVPPASAKETLIDLYPAVIAANPDDAAAVESLLKQRIDLLDALARYPEALADAKILFNVSSMRHTAESLAILDKQLRLAHPNDAALDNQFRKEQIDGAQQTADPGTITSAKTSTVLAGITINSTPFDEALANIKTDATFQEQLRHARLLLIAGKANDAQAIARQAFDSAQFAENADDINTASELIAHCYKAQDGTIGRANAFVASVRAR